MGCFDHRLVCSGQEPAVDLLQVDIARSRHQVVIGGGEALDVAVIDQKPGRVPESEQLALHLVSAGITEPEISVGRVGAVEPAHDIGTHSLERLFGDDQVSP